jgi:Rps23 Pro-64 3,4-dihydroxylase Tpa1-like proline 4-hydroxylase
MLTPAMSTPVRSVPEPFHFDREQLAALAESKREAYASARPFPHIVIDELLPEDVLDRVLAEFPEPKQAEWQTFDSANERKLASKDDSTMGEATRQLLAELNSAAFVDFLEWLTGIKGLVPDPHFVGGGLHQIEPGGHLKVHADFNRHPGTGLERRLNVLLYLNRDWQPEYGGAFELWSRDMSTCEARVLPFFNRCVVFTTTDTSFHGHPEPLSCPEDRTRKSIALYYYSTDRPVGEGGGDHNTLFQARPGEELATPEVDGNRKLGSRLKAAARQVTPPILLNAVRRRRHRA